MPPDFTRGRDVIHRHKIPVGTLEKGAWNEISIRVFNQTGPGGFVGKAPFVMNYFMECEMAGNWEFRTGDEPLMSRDTSFQWTGAYSKDQRKRDAELLKTWIQDQGLNVPDFFAHSHGGTVAHLATRKGVQFDRLVLMGWPVHKRWFPDFSKVNRIIDIRVRLDLVIMLDRGRQRFKTGQFNVERHRNGWFDHSSTHDPDYWDDHGLWSVI